MGTDLHRRSFLAALLGALGAAAVAVPGWPARAAAVPRLDGGPARAPGDVVHLAWPPGRPTRGARWVHRLDGRLVGASSIPAIEGDRVSLAALPADRRLSPGEHRFCLEAGGRTVDGGGFRVAPFLFGC